ncbi:RNA polymerase sigma-70 factor, ECF subfamily [Methylobacillus rhizosphaerae]|uniref:RNA polymerase sigma-70 factor, ECF subfamily n=1 Tax=Methylobacillus rhizosphaerae TaxID=551994 RepID=A0A238YZT6_9PROT|nr:sigma-70 family RNA polymerase sigma factor [Methylobacillus rhizosphaerae]SNR76069.1 RNA polymerase sigma-70 factor, ECF subfamily [Methylobacillus rhizosphaerae]
MTQDHFSREGIIQLLYQEHHAWLRNWINKKLGCTSGAADLAQDTFLSLLLKAELPALQEPRAYLSRVAHGLLVDHLRRRDFERAYLEALAHFSQPEAGSPESRALMLELLIRIDVMLDGLPAKVRTAFLLLQLEGLSYTEIAAQLNVSTRTVGNYIAKAMLQCMLLLEE